MLHGPGANGKTVLMETISALFGEYAGALPADSLKPHRPGSPRNDLDGIRGTRWVTAVELNPNDSLDEALLKQITGGDKDTNAKITLDIFEGNKGAKRDVTLMNSAAALVVAGKSQSLGEAAAMAAEAIDSGKAIEKLKQVCKLSNKL